MKKSCESLREHAMKIMIINFKKKKINLLIKEQQDSHENLTYFCYIFKK